MDALRQEAMRVINDVLDRHISKDGAVDLTVTMLLKFCWELSESERKAELAAQNAKAAAEAAEAKARKKEEDRIRAEKEAKERAAAAEQKRKEEIAAEARRKVEAFAVAEQKRQEDIAAEAKRKIDAAEEARRKAEKKAEEAEAAAKQKVIAMQLDAERLAEKEAERAKQRVIAVQVEAQRAAEREAEREAKRLEQAAAAEVKRLEMAAVAEARAQKLAEEKAAKEKKKAEEAAEKKEREAEKEAEEERLRQAKAEEEAVIAAARREAARALAEKQRKHDEEFVAMYGWSAEVHERRASNAADLIGKAQKEGAASNSEVAEFVEGKRKTDADGFQSGSGATAQQGTATMPHCSSSASSISSSRLERAQARAYYRSASRASDDGERQLNPLRASTGTGSGQPRGQGSGGFSIVRIDNPAAMRASAGGTFANVLGSLNKPEGPSQAELDELLRAHLYPNREAEVASLTRQQAWRAAKVRSCEMEAVCSFTADCLAADADGDTIVSIGGDGDGKSISCYSASKGLAMQSFQGHTAQVCSVAVQGDLIASGCRDKSIRLWSRATGECTTELVGCEDQVYGLALRGDLLLSGEGGKGGKGGKGAKARLWTISNASAVAVFDEHSGPIWSVALGKDMAVSASNDMTARVWLLRAKHAHLGKLVHPSWVYSVSMEHDVAVTACGDGIVRLWSLATLTCLRSLDHSAGTVENPYLQSPVYSVRMLGGMLVSGGKDHNVKVWTLIGDCECLATLAHAPNVQGLALSPDGLYIASTSGKTKKLVVWRP